MRCPALRDLPSPAPGLFGWPWTEESERCPNGGPWPRITVVTPSFNQGLFLEEAIRSVLLQGYPDLEYIVLDGGSSDRSIEIIKKYGQWLHYWESGPDGGQSNAINRGLRLGSGMHATWINSDDMLCRNALTEHAIHHGFDATTVYIGICHQIDAADRLLGTHQGKVQTLEDLVSIQQVWRAGGYIDQPAVLFPLALALFVGGLNENNHRTMDYELWGKFLIGGARFQYTSIPFGMFRIHAGQKTHDMLEQTRSLLETAASFVRHSGCFDSARQTGLLEYLVRYHGQFHKECWQSSGRLARLGLPVPMVRLLRKAKGVLMRSVETLRDAQR